MVGLYLKSLALVAGLAACLFVSAGTWSWGWGWVLVTCYSVFVLFALTRVDQELLLERASPSGFDRGDALLASLGFVFLYPLPLVVAGLDAVRYQLTPPPDDWLRWVGCAGFAGGYAFAFWAMLANRFFTTFQRVQHDRQHYVVRSGPYAYVRHPGYAGMLLAHYGIPLLLGSAWAAAPLVVGTGFFVARVLREERTLAAGLPAYEAYRQRVRWRLLPGFW
ncbi:MAG: isoprenylcysteine carboxylmethyltransferase family protein [Planctomycetales bacterium]|nr:isoprenylcysteine carboxylmethyltransferase family protein [Planctomycetales bacterium]